MLVVCQFFSTKTRQNKNCSMIPGNLACPNIIYIINIITSWWKPGGILALMVVHLSDSSKIRISPWNAKEKKIFLLDSLQSEHILEIGVCRLKKAMPK